jgi:peptide/nickel transport system permease protein
VTTTPEAIEVSDQGFSAAGRGRLVLRRFLRNRPALFGAAVLVLLVLAAFVLPHLLTYSYSTMDFNALLEGPTWRHPFGTNEIGQDVLAQTLRGLQKSLIIGFSVAIFSTIVAASVGSVAGLLGGWTDRTLMWIVDLLLVVPQLILVAIFTPLVKGSGNIILLIVLLAAFNWMISARMVRGLAMGLRDREFVQAARYMGAPTATIIVKHIIPNISSILIIDTTLNVGYAVLAETGLSYLGLGVQPPDVSLGSLIANETDSAFTYPWLFMFAGGLLVLVVLSANLVGDGLRDALDPTSRKARKAAKK